MTLSHVRGLLTKSRACLRMILIVWFISVAAMPTAVAQMAVPQPIDRPVPEEWRRPLSHLLSEIGFHDPEAVLTSAKAGGIFGLFRKATIFRLESDATCLQGNCLTIIARLSEEKFHVEAMFVAGKFVATSDSGTTDTLAHWTHWFAHTAETPGTRNDDIAILETPGGWIVVPRKGNRAVSVGWAKAPAPIFRIEGQRCAPCPPFTVCGQMVGTARDVGA